MPILGDHYGRVLEAGELQLERDGGTFTFHYSRPRACRSPRGRSTTCSTEAAERLELRRAGVPRRLVRQPPALDRDRPASVDRAAPRQGSPPPAAGPALLASSPDASRRPSTRRSTRSTPRRTELDALLGAAELPPGLLADRGPGARLSPLLRHQHPGQPADGGPARLRGHARAGPRLGARGGARRPPGRPPRRPPRPRRSTSSGSTRPPPTAGSSSRRSSSPASRSPTTGPSPARPATTSSTGSAACSSTPPARSRITDFYAAFTGEPADYPAMVRDKKHLRPQGALRQRRSPG